jgi:hypothetical protein
MRVVCAIEIHGNAELLKCAITDLLQHPCLQSSSNQMADGAAEAPATGKLLSTILRNVCRPVIWKPLFCTPAKEEFQMNVRLRAVKIPCL